MILIVGLLLPTGCSVKKDEKEAVQPNIIFFFTDDQAYDTQRDYGNPDVKTPNLDQLADDGMVFLRHYK